MPTKSLYSPLVTLVYVMGIVGCGLLVFGVLITSLPFNPLSTPYYVRSQLVKFVPQGWGFFTRDPRETRLTLYKVHDGKLELQTRPNSTYLLGAGRQARVRTQEVDMLVAGFTRKAWTTTRSLAQPLPPHHVYATANSFRYSNICGQYIVVARAPVPWAWSATRSEEQMPLRFIHFNVLCSL